MVTAVTNLGRSGLYDWLVQRISGVILLAYFTCLGVFIGTNSGMDYATWRGFFDHTALRVLGTAAVLSLAAHAWIGLWCVLTDYVTTRLLGPKANLLRGVLSALCGIAVFTYAVWGLQIVWGGP